MLQSERASVQKTGFNNLSANLSINLLDQRDSTSSKLLGSQRRHPQMTISAKRSTPAVRQDIQACNQRLTLPGQSFNDKTLIKRIGYKSYHENSDEASLSLSEFEITYWFHDQSFPRKQSNKSFYHKNQV